MTIEVNGEPRPVAAGTTLERLVAELGLAGRRIAVEHNRVVVPKTRWQDIALADRDKVEVVQFVGGG